VEWVLDDSTPMQGQHDDPQLDRSEPAEAHHDDELLNWHQALDHRDRGCVATYVTP
jgi:hypothetical protein